jgi:hypothetical protein
MIDNFKFDEASHLYLLNDKRLPSVTEIVKDVYGCGYIADEFYLNKGSMLHKAISLYLQGILDEATVDGRIAGKLQAAKKAVKELNLVPAVIETPMYHKILMYGGTPDLLTVDWILADWKSAPSPLATPPQLGGYAELCEVNGLKAKKALEISLSDNGTYKAEPYDVQRCRRLFIAGLTVYGHKKREG